MLNLIFLFICFSNAVFLGFIDKSRTPGYVQELQVEVERRLQLSEVGVEESDKV